MDGNGSGLTSLDYRTGERAAKGVLLVVCAALFFGVLNMSAVAIVLPEIRDDIVGSWTEFPIVVRDRDSLYTHLLGERRDVRFFYYRNCADLKIFERFARPCPNARDLMLNTLMLPLYTRYPDSEITRNIEAIRRHFGA